MRWVKHAARDRLTNLLARSSGIRGNVDGVQGDALFGWAQSKAAPTKHLRVGLFTQGALLAESIANVHRGDLEAAGIGDGHHGFIFHLSEGIRNLVAANGRHADIKIIGARPVKIGVWRLDDQPADATKTSAEGAKSARAGSSLDKLLYSDVQRLVDVLKIPASKVQTRAPLPATHQKLFDRTDFLDSTSTLPKEMFGYAEYIRYRDRLDEQFDTPNNPDDIAHFFKRYLGLYSAMRGGLRVPLTGDAIAYLNEPVTFGGAVGPFSRIMWSLVLDTPDFVRNMNIKDDDWYSWAIFYWVHVMAKSIHCEDCLVPDYMIKVLQSVPDDQVGVPFPVSGYMRRVTLETPELAAFDVTKDSDRRDLTCAFLVRGISRPETLRYLPPSAIKQCFTKTGGTSAMADFCAKHHPDLAGLTRAKYARALRHGSFDLDAMESLFFTAEGHRFEQAALPPIKKSRKKVDVQVIGPFKKASGLGQAVRLSAQMLEDAGLTVNKVDFGLDNPAPEGFSRSEAVANYAPAKVNLIHLNSEAIPLAYAYQPDAFTDSYNIGYFFWELDSPGACHYLGMDMLDEIWVSTDFGVSIFQPHSPLPVTNVGMSFEDIPDIDRKTARTFLQKTAHVSSDDFVFMVTFDSFSFVQRKNPLGVLAAFEQAFPIADPASKSVRLVIKTQNRTKVGDPKQIKMWARVDAILKNDPRIVLINETLPYADLLKLKKGSDAYVSLHRSEGWGFGLIEAMNLQVPVLTTAYSGNMDFCAPDTCWLVDYEQVELEPHDYIFVRPGQTWADPDIDHAATQMRALRDNDEDRARRTKAAYDKVQTEFSMEAIGARYAARMAQILKGLDGTPKGKS